MVTLNIEECVRSVPPSPPRENNCMHKKIHANKHSHKNDDSELAFSFLYSSWYKKEMLLLQQTLFTRMCGFNKNRRFNNNNIIIIMR